MMPKIDLGGLEDIRPWEHAIRFLFGGTITVIATLITRRFGPTIGGLFLGFPAILPASLTLVKKHDGRRQAVDDARGGRLGSVGLVVFAAVVWAAACAWPPLLALGTATVAWLAVDVSLWTLRHRRAAP
jgi:hypothetical protein